MAVYVVLKSKPYYGNVLGYCIKTGEYIYYHKKQEIWREKGDRELFDYCTETLGKGEFLDIEKCQSYPIYQKYSKSCQEQEY